MSIPLPLTFFQLVVSFKECVTGENLPDPALNFDTRLDNVGKLNSGATAVSRGFHKQFTYRSWRAVVLKQTPT
jgi:hypothetical protein